MFKFRLQRVLELREKREQAQAIQLANAEESASVARTQRDDLQALHTASRAQITSAHIADPTVGHLHHLGYVMSALDQRLGHASQTLTNAEGVVTDARISLEAAARDRRVLDRLKDKHTDAFRAEESHRDRIAMDEVALARFTRQRDAKQQDDARQTENNSASSQTSDGATRA